MKTAFLSLTSLFLLTNIASADQLQELNQTEISAINGVMTAPNLADRLLKCPSEVMKLSRAGATLVEGLTAGSFYGVQTDFKFASGKDKVRLLVRITYKSNDGKPLPAPKVECTLSPVNN